MKNLKQALAKQFVIPVIRETNLAKIMDTCAALAEAGCKVFEITLMDKSALHAIAVLAKDDSLFIGAGTVLNRKQAKLAKNEGAKFLVSPGICEDLLERSPLPYIPGIATPTEAMKAHAAGLSLLKLFPAAPLGGEKYLRALRAPLPQLEWMPTGGIEPNQVSAYRSAGAFCIGMGGKLFEGKKPSEITKVFKKISTT